MGNRGKIGLTELVLWDVVLAGVAAGLVYGDTRMAADQRAALAAKPAKKTVAAKPRAKTSAKDTPRPRGATARVGADPAVARAKQELAALQARARAHLPNDPEQALRTYREAPAGLQASEAWRGFFPIEERRLERLIRERALLVCLRPEVQLAADAGRPDLVQALLQRIPADKRSTLQGEVAHAERTRDERQGAGKTPKKKSGDLEFTGFNPDQAKAEGQHCRVEGGGPSLGKAIASEVDALLILAVDLVGQPLGKKLDLVVLSAADAAKPGKPDQRVTRRRSGESDADLRLRVRLAAARWATRQLFSAGGRVRNPAWRGPWSRLLAGVTSRRGTYNALGRARRALFLTLPAFDGTGAGLTGLARWRGDSSSDLAGAGPFALLHLACFGRSGAAPELKAAAIKAARGGGTLGEFLTPTRAVGLAKPLRQHMERTP